MKNLKFLVMTEEICSDYARQILEGINRFCSQKKISTVICNVRNPKCSEGFFEYQYWAGSKLLNVKEVDVVIILTGVYFSSFSEKEFMKILEPFKNKKIVSISQKLPLENSWSILSDNETVFGSVFDFLVDVCHSRRIAFMDAAKSSSVESRLRFNAYKKNLLLHQMNYDDSIVFHGKFTMESAYEELEDRLGKDFRKIDFDTLIAANDQMALGAMAFFNDHGIKVPEQVKVVGYDDSSEATSIQPSLTSINPFNVSLGTNAARIAFDIAEGIKTDKVMVSHAKLVVRDSTGYGHCKNNSMLKGESLNRLVLRDYDNLYIYDLLDTIQCNDSIEMFLKRIQKTLMDVGIKKFALVLYDEPIIYRKDSEFKMPKKAKVCYVCDNGKGKILSDEFFSPEEHIIPPEIFNDSTESYVAQVISYGEKQYGYMVYSIGERGLIFYNLYVKALSNAIANSYEYTMLYVKNLTFQMEKNELEFTSRTDELSGVLNRRGFDIQGQLQIDSAVASGCSGVVFYGDMNGLKKINDTFGHEFGDRAIKAEAEILKSTFRSTDSIGRIGGDEFAVVAPGFPMRKFEEVKNKIDLNCAEIKKKYGFPFDISISLGGIEFDDKLSDLNVLLKFADQQQYIAKRKFHEHEMEDKENECRSI